MKKFLFVPISITALISLFVFNGCLTFHKVSYVVKLTNPNEGSVTVNMFDIRSTASNNKEFDDDKKNLFQYMLKSKEFVDAQKSQGKDIVSRKLYLENGKLNGQAEYKFSDISNVEGMKYDGGFHYINLKSDDSVIATNGEIIRSQDYKRIVWDSTFTELKFTMLANPFNSKDHFRLLTPYFNQKENR
ncbi:MAG: hypothetical protein M1480_15725 [Bacteroidetes bacterium]|nr:hypothetical protein [Bacteroidota bacterium]